MVLLHEFDDNVVVKINVCIVQAVIWRSSTNIIKSEHVIIDVVRVVVRLKIKKKTICESLGSVKLLN